MRGLIVYDSVFGNTKQIARTMAEVTETVFQVKKVDATSMEDVKGCDLLLVGSPTRGFRPTEAITTFLKNLPADVLKSKPAAAFDTRIPLESISSPIFRRMVKMGGYADKIIGKWLKKKGARLLTSAGFFVSASEGPLVIGEVKRAADWVKETLKAAGG